jgi:hypothetical protein
LKDYSPAEGELFITEAEKAKAVSKRHPGSPMTPLQDAAMMWKTRVIQYLKRLEKCQRLVKRYDDTSYKWPSSFLPTVPQLMCYHYSVEAKDIKDLTLHDLLEDKKNPLLLKNTTIVIGKSDCGKSEVTEAMGAYLTHRHGFTSLYVADALDPLGTLTQNGSIKDMGAFVFGDPDLESCKNEPLSEEEKKRFFRVDKVTTFKARQVTAELPKWRPRFISVNPGSDAKGEVQWDRWFIKQGLPGPAALARKDIHAIRKMSENEIATLKNITIIRTMDYLYVPETEPDMTSDILSYWNQRV